MTDQASEQPLPLRVSGNTALADATVPTANGVTHHAGGEEEEEEVPVELAQPTQVMELLGIDAMQLAMAMQYGTGFHRYSMGDTFRIPGAQYSEYSHQLIIRGPDPAILGFCCYAEHKGPGMHHVALEVIATHGELPQQAQRQCFAMLITPMFNRMFGPASGEIEAGARLVPNELFKEEALLTIAAVADDWQDLEAFYFERFADVHFDGIDYILGYVCRPQSTDAMAECMRDFAHSLQGSNGVSNGVADGVAGPMPAEVQLAGRRAGGGGDIIPKAVAATTVLVAGAITLSRLLRR